MSPPRPQEPEILAFVAEVESFYPPDAVDLTVDAQRRCYDDLCRHFDAHLPPDLTVGDAAAAHPDAPVPLRRYRPAGIRQQTVIVYFHGGGFVVGGLDSHHAVCAEIATATGSELCAVDYRLAPEHRFPLALTDCLAALLAQAGRPIVVAGDSAGGNLAAGVAMTLRDAARGTAAAMDLLRASGWQPGAPLPRVTGQALIYPVLGGRLDSGSFVEMAEAPGLTTADVRYYRDILGAPEGDPYGHPLAAADWSGLPPAYITAAHFDPLRDDGRHYAARLAEAGVAVTYREEPQMVHAWLRARHHSPGARAAFAALCRGVDELLTAV
ncbi:MAG: alpha/beta hydrolase [Kiloniellaceae bacterium]